MLTGFLSAQGTLQFDHVNFEQLVSNSGSDPIVSIIVPSGQVFKLISAQLYRSTSYSLNFKKSSETTYAPLISSSIDYMAFPIWLSDGSYDFKQWDEQYYKHPYFRNILQYYSLKRNSNSFNSNFIQQFILFIGYLYTELNKYSSLQQA